MNLQPYQQAGQEIQRQGQAPTNLAKTTLAYGAGLASSGIAKKIIPLLSQFVPGDIMRKGLSKVDPRIGKFVENALNNGYSIDDVREFMSSKFGAGEMPEEAKNENAEVKHNPIQEFETNYPDIAGALARTMQNGQSPQAAAAIIKQSTPFSKSIKKLESEVGKNFVDYVVELFGPQQQQQAQGGQQMGQQMQQSGQPQAQPQQQPGQGQGGGIDQEIMAALDKILKM